MIRPMTLWQPRYSNCLIWAFWMQWTRGGRVCWRQSWYGWWPHAVWSGDNGRTYYEYLPVKFSGHLKWWQVMWLVVFRGAVRKVGRDIP